MLRTNKYVDQFDYYAERKNVFYEKFEINSILVYGKHRKPSPLVSVIITTYKRPEYLKKALESAINQVKFEDYQILVVDNEGVPISVQTETSKLMENYRNNEKVIYYRHASSVPTFRMDSAFRLARSKWICSLHDDDVLVENHLVNMVQAISNHPEIHYLSCKYEGFKFDMQDQEIKKMCRSLRGTCNIVKYPNSSSCWEHYPGWHGALIDRKRYIYLGGMPSTKSPFGDVIMVFKFMYYFGIYELETEKPLYLYRQGHEQICKDTISDRIKINTDQYFYYLYNIRKHHKSFLYFWDNIAAYKIIDNTRNMLKLYKNNDDLYELVNSTGMYPRILDNHLRKIIFEEILNIYLKIKHKTIVQKDVALIR